MIKRGDRGWQSAEDRVRRKFTVSRGKVCKIVNGASRGGAKWGAIIAGRDS